MRVAAIIQARMRSTRLPGKVLLPVGGRPVLEHIIRRLRRARSVHDIAVTTSTESEDEAIVQFCAGLGVKVFRGPEADVLGRFEIAARALDPDIIVRVTGDSPLIDPLFLDTLVGEMLRTGADFLTLKDGTQCIQEGVDPFSRRALRVLLGEAREDNVAREHVTGWLKAHTERVRTAQVAIDPAYEFSGARLSIDTPADLEFFAALAARADLETVSLKDVATLLRREPWLRAINAHVHQKAASEVTSTVLIRADGGGQLGYGHLTRALALAEQLRDGHGIGIVALTGVHPMGDAQAARAFFEAHRIPAVTKPPGADEAAFIRQALRRANASALVLDIRTGLSPADLDAARAAGVKIVTIDDASARRLKADLAVYPPAPQVSALDWSGHSGVVLAGADYALLAPAVARRAARGAPPAKSRFLISMGGSDPQSLTQAVVQACAERIAAPIDVVIGPGVEDGPGLACRLLHLNHVTPHLAPKDPCEIYTCCRAAIISFGVTAYELAALGVPALYVALSEDHRTSALGAQALGFGRIGGMARTLDPRALGEAAARLWQDEARLTAMSRAGRAVIDGRGAERLASLIAELIRRPAQEAQAPVPPEKMPRPNRQPAVGG
jgi:spore coat polysaccharide biosynthesis protein SpsF